MHTTVLVNGNNMRRVAVTCKCGNRFVEEIPGEVFAGGAKPILTCNQCQQSYVMLGGRIRRFDHGMLGAELPKKALTDPVDEELSDTGDVQPQDPAAWKMPGSNSIQ